MHLHGDRLLELAALLDLEHEVAAVDVLHDEVEPVHRLEARVQLDEERRLGGEREHVLLDESALDVVVLDDDVLLQDLDRVQLVRALALGEHHLVDGNRAAQHAAPRVPLSETYLAEAALAEHHQEVEVRGADDVLPAHVVRKLAVELGRLPLGGRRHAAHRGLRADLLPELLRVEALRDGHVVVLALLLGEQLEPALDRRFDDLRYAERERAHEVVARRPVPVPHFDQQSPVLVLRLQLAFVANIREKRAQQVR